MSDSDDAIIFEKRLSAEQAKEVADRLVAEGRFEIEFSVVNDRIRFSHTQSSVPLRHIADAIVEAVSSNWPVSVAKYEPRQAPSLELGSKTVTYNRMIALNWADRAIVTSLGPKEGKLFLRVLAYFVSQFRAPTRTEAPSSEVN